MDKRTTGMALALGVALGLFLGVTWMAMQQKPAQTQVAVASTHPPVALNIVPTKWITEGGSSTEYGAAYYREAVGYISSTVAAGYITYTWQSSPDKVVWFDQDYVAGGNASRLVTTTLDYFGPYLRLSWEAMSETSVTGTVWVNLKE